MKKLLENPEKYYSPKERPSGHSIGKSFGVDNGGAIPSNLLQISNSESNSNYLALCKKSGIKGHPARFPYKLPEFFIKFLTKPNDLVVDIFSGSNTTGFTAEKLNRNWLSFDLDEGYTGASAFRFMPKETKEKELHYLYHSIKAGETIDIWEFLEKMPTKISTNTKNYLNAELENLESSKKLNKKQLKYKTILDKAHELFELKPSITSE